VIVHHQDRDRFHPVDRDRDRFHPVVRDRDRFHPDDRDRVANRPSPGRPRLPTMLLSLKSVSHLSSVGSCLL
jgi:hypothetical protein